MFKEKKVKKAIFPVAGFGTRFLPATKAMPKELLPILNKPLIQFAVEEAVDADIDTLIFITGRNKRAIEDHFDVNVELSEFLKHSGNSEKINQIENIIPENITCIFVRQNYQLGLGHAVLCAEKAVGNEPFAVLLADDLIFSSPRGATKRLLDSFYESGKTQILSMEVDGPQISNYGVLKFDESKQKVVGMVEKPSVDEAPSKSASIGRYVFNPDLFEIIKQLPVGSNREIQLADAIGVLASMGLVENCKFEGTRFDCGSIDGFLEATMFYAKKQGLKKSF